MSLSPNDYPDSFQVTESGNRKRSRIERDPMNRSYYFHCVLLSKRLLH
jgi:hypothetical protein